MLALLTLNHKDFPVSRIEKAYLKEVDKAYSDILSLDGISGLIIIQTCNRVELYIDCKDTSVISDVIEYWCAKTGDEEIRSDVKLLVDKDAIEHLFRLVCGLESMAFGEHEIFHQVKEAYSVAAKNNALSNLLRRVVEESFRVGKHVRSKVLIGHRRASLASVFVDYIEELINGFEDKAILIVGAGEIGSQVVESLRRRKVRKLSIIIANRTYENAVKLANKVGGIALHLSELDKYLSVADVAFVTTSAPHYILTKDRLEESVHNKEGKCLYIADLSVPTNVEPSVKELRYVRYISLDDVADRVKLYSLEAEKVKEAEEYIKNATEAIVNKLFNKTENIIANVYKYAEEVRLQELDEALRKLGDYGRVDKVREVLDSMSKSLVKKLLHPYSEYLRRSSSANQQL